jgi:metal-responsive CopG/Arc/MetJ family transcriptional regulator
MTTISLKLPASLLAQLEVAAQRRGTSKSALVREFLDHGLRGHRNGRKQTCYDLTRHLAGSLHGPRDIATNPAHLRCYGE